jgi:hypothetical protein
MDNFFITGQYRSGTTLLEKLINVHSEVIAFSQPCAPLFFHFKDKFNRSKGIIKPYPITPEFPHEGFSWEELFKFLERDSLLQSDWNTIFQEIVTYKGRQELGLENIWQQIKEDVFCGVFRQILNKLNKGNVAQVGSKEILCEEFTTAFLEAGIKCIIIVRDPRDIICSLNFGKGEDFTGKIRPLLYSLRLWRKSVAFSIYNSSSPNFKMIRYEDLVANPELIMKEVFAFLGLEAQSVSFDWEGNSSFGKLRSVSISSVGNYKKLLDKKTIKYIETICFPEMKYMGYEVEIPFPDEDTVNSFQEPFKVSHLNFDPNYSSDDSNRKDEIERIHLMYKDKITAEEQSRFFYFQQVYNKLKFNFNKSI